MKVYTTDKIRNVAILGHGGAGKTSLVEAMAYLSKMTTRMGKVDDGNTISDYSKEEQKRKFSIFTSVVPLEWDDTKINILDTPGFFDFVGEVEEALAAAASAIIVINGKAGVEPGTKRAWDLCEKFNIPRYFYISNMDVDDASFKKVLEELTELYGKKIAPFNFPIRENEKYNAYIISVEGCLAEIMFETEWNLVTCYIDTETEEVLGLMAEAKSSDELIEELRKPTDRAMVGSASPSGDLGKAA